MFILNGKPLSPDVAFEHQGIQYPSNWLRLSSLEERAAVGITEEPDPISVDQRFWWDTGIPKDHDQLVKQWVGQVKQTAGSLLAQTDWYITRNAETQIPVPQSVLDRRTEIRNQSNVKEAALKATSSTEELAAYVTGPNFNNWNEPVIQSTVTTEAVSGAFGNDTITL